MSRKSHRRSRNKPMKKSNCRSLYDLFMKDIPEDKSNPKTKHTKTKHTKTKHTKTKHTKTRKMRGG